MTRDQDLNESVQAAAWQAVVDELDEGYPEWRGAGDLESQALPDAARRAIRRLATDATEHSIVLTQIRQEMAAVRAILDAGGLPAAAERGLRSHLMRMARML